MNYPILYKKDTTDFSTLGNAILNEASEICIHQVINGEYTAEFILPSNDSALSVAEYDDFIKIDGQLFRIRGISPQRDSEGRGFVRISCNHVWYDACDCKYIHHTFTKSGEAEIDGWIGVTPRWVMEKVFSDTPFTVGEVEITTPTDIFATKANPAAIVTQLIEKVGGQLDRDNYTVHLRKGDDQYNGKRIMYGKNIKSVRKEMDDTGVITRLYPLGQDDMDISSVNDGVAYIDSPIAGAYGYIKCGYENMSHITDPEELLTEAQKLWSTDIKDGIDKPKVSYTVETPDLENVRIGDTVRVTDKELGIDILTRVEEMTSYPAEPYRSSIVLSNHRNAGVGISDKILSGISTLQKITDNKGNIMSQYIDNVREKIQSQVDDATSKRLTVHQFGDIWVDNVDNPTKAMVIADGIFAVANSKKHDGDWDWRTIGTADVFMADTINAPWINAGYIDTDQITIRSEDGNASLTGSRFTITTPDGFETTMSAEDGFRYIYKRDKNGNPYDYTVFSHEGQKRYWHGHLIPSTYQFAKGTVKCKKTTNTTTYGVIELEGAAWQEIARVYNKIIEDDNLTDLEKYDLINQMVRASVTPTRITDEMSDTGAVILENEFVSQEIGVYTVPKIIEISSSGTTVNLKNSKKTLNYDGAAMLYFGAGGYVRPSGNAPNACYSLEAVYDIAITLDIDYE